MSPVEPQTLNQIAAAVASFEALDVLFLFGSRARGDAHEHSDWDFAYLGGAALDAGQLHATLALVLGTDRVNLVDLHPATGLLRARAARDGIVIVERVAHAADAFRLAAISFWCDMGPILESEYEAVLAELQR